MKIHSLDDMMAFGESVATRVQGAMVFELVGDVGAGKTSFTKGLARGLGVREAVQSPTFTISREYALADGRRLVHYDFYRLREAGIMAEELNEVIHDPSTITVVEWAETVADILPKDRVTLHIKLTPEDENARIVTWAAGGEYAKSVMQELAV